MEVEKWVGRNSCQKIDCQVRQKWVSQFDPENKALSINVGKTLYPHLQAVSPLSWTVCTVIQLPQPSTAWMSSTYCYLFIHSSLTCFAKGSLRYKLLKKWSWIVAIASRKKPVSDLHGKLQTRSDTKKDSGDRQDTNDKKWQFRSSKYIMLLAKVKASVPINSSCLPLIFMALHTNSMGKEVIPLASDIGNSLPPLPLQKVSILAKIQRKFPKGLSFGVTADQPDTIFYLNEASFVPTRLYPPQ